MLRCRDSFQEFKRQIARHAEYARVSLAFKGNSNLFQRVFRKSSFECGNPPKKKDFKTKEVFSVTPQKTHYLPAPQSRGTGKKIQEKIIQAWLFQTEDLFAVCSPTLSTCISQTMEGSGRVWAWQGCGGQGVPGIHGSTFTSHTGKLWVIGIVHVSIFLPHVLYLLHVGRSDKMPVENYPWDFYRWRKFVAAIFHWRFFGCNLNILKSPWIFDDFWKSGISNSLTSGCFPFSPFHLFEVGWLGCQQLRNRLAKLEQALRNKDEPGDSTKIGPISMDADAMGRDIYDFRVFLMRVLVFFLIVFVFF